MGGSGRLPQASWYPDYFILYCQILDAISLDLPFERLRGSGNQPAYVVIWIGPADEGRRYVWLLFACSCRWFRLPPWSKFLTRLHCDRTWKKCFFYPLAYNPSVYNLESELVETGENGMVFKTSSELADIIVKLLPGFQSQKVAEHVLNWLATCSLPLPGKLIW